MNKTSNPHSRLGLERLDDRTVPSATGVSISTSGGIMPVPATAVSLPAPAATSVAVFTPTLVAEGADGRVVVVSFEPGRTSLQVTRLNADGSLDKSFGDGGTVELNLASSAPGFRPSAIAVAPDGAIVLAGFSTGPDGQKMLTAVRLTADGVLDDTFSGDGVGIYNAWPAYSALAVSVGTDGSVTIGGAGDRFTPTLFRIRPDGTVDKSFGTDGTVELSVRGGFQITCLVQLPDGGILAVGTTDRALQSPTSGPGTVIISALPAFDVAVTRVNSNGTIDTGYGTDGTVEFTTGPHRSVTPTSAVLLADGELQLVLSDLSDSGLNSDSTASLARLTADGKLDTAYGGGKGFFALPPMQSGLLVGGAVQPDGRATVVFFGSNPAGGGQVGLTLVGVTADGRIDPAVGKNGTDFVPTPEAKDMPYNPSVVMLPGGKVGVIPEPEYQTGQPTRVHMSVIDPDARTAPPPPQSTSDQGAASSPGSAPGGQGAPTSDSRADPGAVAGTTRGGVFVGFGGPGDDGKGSSPAGNQQATTASRADPPAVNPTRVLTGSAADGFTSRNGTQTNSPPAGTDTAPVVSPGPVLAADLTFPDQ